MALIKYKPQNDSWLDRFFNDDFFNSDLLFPSFLDRFSVLTDISQTDKEFAVEFALPGFKKNEIKLEINNGVLRISGERSEKNKFLNKVERNYSLPENIEAEKIEAKLEDGILKISIPKIVKEEKESKLIEIK